MLPLLYYVLLWQITSFFPLAVSLLVARRNNWSGRNVALLVKLHEIDFKYLCKIWSICLRIILIRSQAVCLCFKKKKTIIKKKRERESERSASYLHSPVLWNFSWQKAVLHVHNLWIILEIKCLITVDISEPIAGGAHLKSDIVYYTTRLRA